MKNLMTRTLIALATLTLTGSMAFAAGAGDIKEELTFTKDMTINGVLVKKGTYNVRFNEKTGEVAILQGKNEVVRTSARLVDRKGKSHRTEITYTENGSTRNLQEIAFDGDSQSISIGNNGAAAATPQQ
ncbi:MAG: hypothetical protein K1Y36_20975 [Blastocatellia bacterium]|nr:hypothetical protein [Blastocatellia bacterium]